MNFIIDFILHIDKHLADLTNYSGDWSYVVLGVIIFAETGLVVTPFLPGDSLLFAAGALAAKVSFNLNIAWLFLTLAAAAVIGDSVNYLIGKIFGEKLFRDDRSRFFKKKYLDRTHQFYEKYGRKTIILARFVPIIRTFAPFVAGMGKMNYLYFFTANVLGGVLWVALFVIGGSCIGNIPFVNEHFSLIALMIIILSVIPLVIEVWRYRANRAQK